MSDEYEPDTRRVAPPQPDPLDRHAQETQEVDGEAALHARRAPISSSAARSRADERPQLGESSAARGAWLAAAVCDAAVTHVTAFRKLFT